MSKCSDCLHFSLCDYNTDVSNTPIKLYSDEGAEKCSFFKDKARYIEPPCKIGDAVYTIKTLTDGKFTRVVSYGKPVYRISVDKYGMFLTTEYGHVLSCDDFGKTVFLTREEAEQALKEKL